MLTTDKQAKILFYNCCKCGKGIYEGNFYVHGTEHETAYEKLCLACLTQFEALSEAALDFLGVDADKALESFGYFGATATSCKVSGYAGEIIFEEAF